MPTGTIGKHTSKQKMLLPVTMLIVCGALETSGKQYLLSTAGDGAATNDDRDYQENANRDYLAAAAANANRDYQENANRDYDSVLHKLNPVIEEREIRIHSKKLIPSLSVSVKSSFYSSSCPMCNFNKTLLNKDNVEIPKDPSELLINIYGAAGIAMNATIRTNKKSSNQNRKNDWKPTAENPYHHEIITSLVRISSEEPVGPFTISIGNTQWGELLKKDDCSISKNGYIEIKFPEHWFMRTTADEYPLEVYNGVQ